MAQRGEEGVKEFLKIDCYTFIPLQFRHMVYGKSICTWSHVAVAWSQYWWDKQQKRSLKRSLRGTAKLSKISLVPGPHLGRTASAIAEAQ